MTTHIVIIGHNQLAQELLTIARSMVNFQHGSVECICIPADISASHVDSVSTCLNSHSEKEILILCDLYGATPYNIVSYYNKSRNIKLIAGLNLSMLLTAIQNLNKPLSNLIEKC